MSIIRRPKPSDVEAIQKIAKESGHPLVEKFEHAAVIDGADGINAFGVLRTNLEAILYCSGRPRDKVLALATLINQSIEDARELKYDDIYVFAKDEAFADILIRKFGFRRAGGVPLILDLNK